MSRWKLLLILAGVVGVEMAVALAVDFDDVRDVLFAVADAVGLPFNTMIVLAGTSLLGLVAGVVGAFAVLRRRALVGDAVSHAALPGLAIAFLIAGQKDFLGMMIGAGVAGLFAVAVISWLSRHTRTKNDAAIGIALSVLFGLGIALSRIIQNMETGRMAGLDSYLFGKTAGMVTQDLLLIIVVAINLLLLVTVLFKEFTLISFDPDFAATQGWPTGLVDMLLMGAIVVATIIGLPAVGVVLMAALLILPGVAARFWTDNLGQLLFLAAAFGVGIGATGTWLSAEFHNLPTGPMIVLTGATIFFLSAIFAPHRGILARYFGRIRFDRRIAKQTLLRTMYELTEPALPQGRPIAAAELLARRTWTDAQLRRLFALTDAEGCTVRTADGTHALTPAGLSRAAKIVGAHRMWELVLTGRAGGELSPENISRDADEIGEALPLPLLADLETELRNSGRWPSGAPPIAEFARPHAPRKTHA